MLPGDLGAEAARGRTENGGQPESREAELLQVNLGSILPSLALGRQIQRARHERVNRTPWYAGPICRMEVEALRKNRAKVGGPIVGHIEHRIGVIRAGR